MRDFICTRCNKTLLALKENYAYELKEKACPKCKAVGTWQVYAGPIADTMLANEDAKLLRLTPQLNAARDERRRLKDELDVLQAQRQKAQRAFEARQNMTAEEAAAEADALEKLNANAIAKTDEWKAAEKKARMLDEEVDNLGNREAVKKAAVVAYDAANDVQQRSAKNKLYIGNRQYVSQHVQHAPLKKARILDVPNWSPGLNVAWVEGGIAAKANFKLKLNPGDPYATLPVKLLEEFRADPAPEAHTFFALCRSKGRGSLLWFDRDGFDRPTWTALEIYCLLRAGYTFTFSDSRRGGAGSKVVLTPPA